MFFFSHKLDFAGSAVQSARLAHPLHDLIVRLPVLAGLFRSGPRSPSNPVFTSYPRGLQPVASEDVLSPPHGGVSHRLSKTNLDFESALRAEGTVLLKEGLDVSSLGVVDGSPSTPRRTSPSNTLVVVPPTPESHSSSPQGASLQSGNPSNSNGISEASLELQNKRRSMFRSPGTASSPDLATLLRKAKENGGVIPSSNGFSRRETADHPPGDPGAGFLSPNQNSTSRLRGSSSTSSFSVVSASAVASPRTPTRSTAAELEQSNKGKGVNGGGSAEEQKADHQMTSPRARSGSKSGKSMRVRATNFLGKMLGQDSSREKSRQDPTTPTTPVYTAPPLFARFASHADNPPPVPQIPETYRQPPLSPARTSDVFNNSPTSPHLSKPLPPIQPKGNKRISEDEIGRILTSDMSLPSPTPERTLKPRPREGDPQMRDSISSSRRRSATVGDGERKKVHADADFVPTTSAARQSEDVVKTSEWDTDGIMSLFQGDLSQMEKSFPSSSLEIKDPSTPQRPINTPRMSFNPDKPATKHSDGMNTIRPRVSESTSWSAGPPISSITETERSSFDPRSPSGVKRASFTASADRASARRVVSRPTPQISLPSQYVPPRTVSTPMLGVMSPSTPLGKQRGTPTSPTFARDATRETIQPRGRASSSEPVLLTNEDDDSASPRNFHQAQSQSQSLEFQRTVRLVPTTRFPHPSKTQASGSSSPIDVSVNDLSSGWTPTSSSPGRGVNLEGDDLEMRGQELARLCWMDDESFIPKDKFAEWLGGAGRLNAVALHHYVDFYDLAGLRLDHAFRRFCAKLYLKGETQQIDRILSEFSRRYWECNPNSIYGSTSVVHAVAYSILLLNTDLHVADLSTHMSRNQFVRNTVQAIQSQAKRSSTPDLTYDDGSSDTGGSTVRSRSKRSSSVHSWTSALRDPLGTPSTGAPSMGQLTASPTVPVSLNASAISVQTPVSGQMSTSTTEPRIRTAASQSSSSVTSIVHSRNWDVEMENMLRDMYTSIKSSEIRQPEGFQPPSGQMSTLAPNTPYNTLMRHRSQRGQDRISMLKRGSIRGIQTLFGQQAGTSPYSSNSSIEGRDPRDGRVSPSPSFATSLDGIPTASSFFTPALGFASNLSHTIIRETQEDDIRSIKSDTSADTSVSISDAELALLGAPWAKEGMLCRKQYWESAGKRAKSKAWQDVFVVIQKGELDMFVFGERGGGDAHNLGGGNWLANAQHVGNVMLAHSLAHVLPPPGYNRQRPYCFVLTLASGAVYFFQAGTEDLINEWVSTCNYWAARQSKEPLSGGVSNMEYGWNRVLYPDTQTTTVYDEDSVSIAEPSDAFSIRSGRSGRSVKKRSWPDAGTIGRNTERIIVHDWKPPIPPAVSSTHDEEAQLEALQKQVTSLNKDLQTHNELQKPMTALYNPRSNNLTKALSNWEKKSQHLLTEIVKYETYVESLKTAMSLRLKKRGEKALERALVSAAPVSQEEIEGGTKREENAVDDGREPSTPGQAGFKHKREVAETMYDAAKTP